MFGLFTTRWPFKEIQYQIDKFAKKCHVPLIAVVILNTDSHLTKQGQNILALFSLHWKPRWFHSALNLLLFFSISFQNQILRVLLHDTNNFKDIHAYGSDVQLFFFLYHCPLHLRILKLCRWKHSMQIFVFFNNNAWFLNGVSRGAIY